MPYPLIISYLNIEVFTNFNEVLAFLKEKGIENSQLSDKVAGFVYSGLLNDNTLVVWIDIDYGSSISVQETIAHETIHVVEHTLRSLGIRGRMPEEAYAQCVGRTYRHIVEKIKDLGYDFNTPPLKR